MNRVDFPPGENYRTILGIRFFTGSAVEAVQLGRRGGLVVVPSAPVLTSMAEDPATGEALIQSDLALTDSGLMVLLWNFLRRDRIRRVSGLEYLKLLLELPEGKIPGAIFWIMPGEAMMKRSVAWLRRQGHAVTEEDCYIAPHYGSGPLSDPVLLQRLAERRPRHIVLAIGGGVQERLGYSIRRHLDSGPGIHCTGAAIGFLTGDQVRIPMWADRFTLGWLFRCFSAPQRFIPRYWKARRLVRLLLDYGERSPLPEETAATRQ